MIVSNHTNSYYTPQSSTALKKEAAAPQTTFKDVYQSTVKTNNIQKQASYSLKQTKSTQKQASNTVKEQTMASAIQKGKIQLDEAGVPKDYFPDWPTDIRKSFFEHDKNLTPLEQVEAPSHRIAMEMLTDNYNPNNYPSKGTENEKFLAMVEDIKQKWEKCYVNAKDIPQEQRDSYEKALKDVDKLLENI